MSAINITPAQEMAKTIDHYEVKVYENGVLLGGSEVRTTDRRFADQLFAQAEDEARQKPWNGYFISVLACPWPTYPAPTVLLRPYFTQKYSQVGKVTIPTRRFDRHVAEQTLTFLRRLAWGPA